jgi:hypothetical protein
MGENVRIWSPCEVFCCSRKSHQNLSVSWTILRRARAPLHISYKCISCFLHINTCSQKPTKYFYNRKIYKGLNWMGTMNGSFRTFNSTVLGRHVRADHRNLSVAPRISMVQTQSGPLRAAFFVPGQNFHSRSKQGFAM